MSAKPGDWGYSFSRATGNPPWSTLKLDHGVPSFTGALRKEVLYLNINHGLFWPFLLASRLWGMGWEEDSLLCLSPSVYLIPPEASPLAGVARRLHSLPPMLQWGGLGNWSL